MQDTAIQPNPVRAPGRSESRVEHAHDLDALRHAIDHAAHLLPAQGPITVFIHHNTLHAFEQLPFAEAVKKAGRIFGCHPYLPESRYRDELSRGRIRFADLESILREDLGPHAETPVGRLGTTRLELRLAMLQYPLRFGPTEELLWFVAETDALRRVRPDASAAVRGRLIAETRRWVMRDLRGGPELAGNWKAAARWRGSARAADGAGLAGLLERFGESRIEEWDEGTWEAFTLQALWRVCCQGLANVPVFTPPPAPPLRHRDLLLQVTGEDSDLLVHDLLIRFCGAFLDQGLAHWQLPRREEGFYRAFIALYRQRGGPPDRWLAPLAAELKRLEEDHVGPLESVHESLDALGVPALERDEFLAATLLALRGWGGITRFLEERGDRVVHPAPRGSLVEFLAIRLLLDRLALTQTARDTLGYTGPLAELRGELHRRAAPPPSPGTEQRAFLVFQLAQVLGWTPEELHRQAPEGWTALVAEIEAFSTLERQRVFHLAYEQRFYTQALDAVALHPRQATRGGPPQFQAVFCIDEREESLRRHLEEVAPDCETFGAAGFFGVAIYYRGAADAHFVPLCPIVMQPQHWVTEEVAGAQSESHRRRARARRVLGAATHRFHLGSRSFALGALLTAGVGVLAALPLVARILFPRLTARLRSLFGRLVQAPPATRLRLERHDSEPGPLNGQVGYTVEEMTTVAERLLQDIGLTSGFAPLVLLLGHGSFSQNNPHKSAYDCGACGGSPGAPNGRALAQILNDPRVRARLASRGLTIPASTLFVGGLHNTCDDTVTLWDLDGVPENRRHEVDEARRSLEAALDRNAHERCRRFMSAPLTLSFAAARQHVEGRAADLAQTRPELGHATNAICFVGRRERTRGLFLDRRAFLTSYDPTTDGPESPVLTRLLQAVVPVCSGINLEYYFSRVDQAGWGCGTKLPHNVAALLGVMDGAASDLRTGLPWQMVEIHEPVRLLFILETTPDAILAIMDRHPAIGRMVRNDWVRLALLDPHSQRVSVYRDGAFHDYCPHAPGLPRVASSVAWYRGWRDHLEFAEIGE